tara:strand:+ start:255 stop:479 length:225 start_codon:yes stop_codon:yes gene_type:complete
MLKWLNRQVDEMLAIVLSLNPLWFIPVLIFMIAIQAIPEKEDTETTWEEHQIHFRANQDQDDCEWCISYNTMRP